MNHSFNKYALSAHVLSTAIQQRKKQSRCPHSAYPHPGGEKQTMSMQVVQVCGT